MPTKTNSKKIEKAWIKSRNREKDKVLPTVREISHRWMIVKEAIKMKSKIRKHSYLQNSSINCYGYLADDTLQWEEK